MNSNPEDFTATPGSSDATHFDFAGSNNDHMLNYQSSLNSNSIQNQPSNANLQHQSSYNFPSNAPTNFSPFDNFGTNSIQPDLLDDNEAFQFGSNAFGTSQQQPKSSATFSNKAVNQESSHFGSNTNNSSKNNSSASLSSTGIQQQPSSSSSARESLQSDDPNLNLPRRSRASGEILALLIAEFNKNSNPNTSVRKAISSKTGMSERSVRIWFQNRRAKARKIEKLHQSNGDESNKHNTFTFNGGDSYREAGTRINNTNNSGFPFKKSELLNNLQNRAKIPIEINDKYSLIDCLSVSVGPWQRIKSGYFSADLLNNLHNLSPRLLNSLMLTTDLLIVMSKKDHELNYFFSGVFQNEKVLFRIFYPVANILSCSLINYQTQRPITSRSRTSYSKKNKKKNKNVYAETSSKSDEEDKNMNFAKKENEDILQNEEIDEDIELSTNENDEADENEEDEESPESTTAQLQIQLATSPKFAVHFLRDPATGKENLNQWSICEDFSEGQQVVNAFVGEGGSEVPHILTGGLEYLQYLNSSVVSFSQSISHSTFPGPSTEHPILEPIISPIPNTNANNNQGNSSTIIGSPYSIQSHQQQHSSSMNTPSIQDENFSTSLALQNSGQANSNDNNSNISLQQHHQGGYNSLNNQHLHGLNPLHHSHHHLSGSTPNFGDGELMKIESPILESFHHQYNENSPTTPDLMLHSSGGNINSGNNSMNFANSTTGASGRGVGSNGGGDLLLTATSSSSLDSKTHDKINSSLKSGIDIDIDIDLETSDPHHHDIKKEEDGGLDVNDDDFGSEFYNIDGGDVNDDNELEF